MKDDPEFNIYFVSLIEKHRSIYDFTCDEYSDRQTQDRAWDMIAEEVLEPVSECKERWRNLRACFTRYLKSLNPGGKKRRKYYLAEYLNFLLPFTKTRKREPNFQPSCLSVDIVEEENNYVDEYGDCSSSEEQNEQKINIMHEEMAFSAPAAKKVKHVVQKSSEDDNKTYELKKSSTEITTEDSDVFFLKSLVSDMKEMNSDQKRRFKIGILNLAGQILNESEAVFSNNSFSVMNHPNG